MPNIRTYISNAPPLHADDRGAQAEAQFAFHAERQAGIIPGEIEGATRALREGLKDVEKHEAMQETSSVYRQITSLAAEAHDDLSKTLNSADPSKGNPIPAWASGFLQSRLSKIEEGLSTPEAQQEFQRASAGLQETLTDHGIGQWDSLVKQHTLNNVDQSTVSLGNAGVTDPASLPGLLRMSDAGIASFVKSSEGRVSAEEGTKLARDARQRIADTSAQSLVEQAIKNPAFNTDMASKLEEQLRDPVFTENMSPEKRVQLLSVISSAHGTQEAAESQIFKSRLPALIDQVKLTGDTRQIDAGIQMFRGKTPEETTVGRQEVLDKRNEALAFYTVSHDAGMIPRDKEADYLAQRQTDLKFAMPDRVGAANAANEAAKKYFAERDKAFSDGTQASFLIDHNETLNAYYGQWSQNPTPENFERYAAYSEGVQHHLMPNAPANILTPQMAQDIATTMHNLRDAGAPAVEAQITRYKTLYGSFWGQIATEALEKHAMSDTQYVAAQLYGQPQNYGLAATLLRASTMSQKDLQATADAVGGQGAINPAGANAAAATSLQEFAKTLGNTSNGNQILSAYTGALSRILMMEGGTDNSDKYAQQMLTSNYTLSDTVRVPNWMGLDTGAIHSALSGVSDMVAWDSVVVPPSFSGLGPKDQKTNYIASLQSTGKWYTNQDETGVTLYDENGYNVLAEKNGKPAPITLTWKQLEARGGSVEGPINQSGIGVSF